LSDTQIKDTYTHNNYSGVENDGGDPDDGDENYDNRHWTHYDHTWKFSPGGSGSRQDTDITVDWGGMVYTNATSGVMQWSPVDAIETDTANDGTVTTNLIGLPTFGDEHCMVSDPKNPPAVVYGLDGWDDDIVTNTYSEEYSRYAQTKWHLDTGGKALPQRQNLWQFTGWAKKVLDKRAVPTFGGANMQDITNTAVAIGSIGNLTADGTYWKALTGRQSLDATPFVAGEDFYAFGVNGQKYTLTISANGTSLDPDQINVTNCVGQNVNFQIDGLPSVSDAVAQWSLPAKFVNRQPYSYCSGFYDEDASLLNRILSVNGNLSTSCWFVRDVQAGSAKVSMNVFFPNGQVVFIQTSGNLTVYCPRISAFHKDGNGFSAGSDGLHGLMSWDAYIDTKYAGLFGATQIITCNDSISDYYTHGNLLLDGSTEIYGEQPPNISPKQVDPSNPINNFTFFGDEPSDPFANSLGIVVHPCVTMIANFKDYIRFKPTGGIYVTLATCQWHMNGSLCQGWTDPSPDDLPPVSDRVDSDEFPYWISTR
jgi:hypothetical protein